ncbi:DUF1232 domain-containing protein [Pseudoalteromonas sp. T1lg88]|uniref:DUF1232 domain-containing protein n=1 Tax=Pseudoalteromonas sp. T1lg88 TaxID=2077104 RepID=UPI000CF64245|nr:DUF1232 domain-containing protein [Pseudoalteromonas sp. T1lg88]
MNKRTVTPERAQASRAHGVQAATSWLCNLAHAVLARILLLYYAISGDTCTPLHRLALCATLAYVAFPYDLITDTYPSLGLLDDILLLAVAAVSLLAFIDARVKVLAELKAHQLLLKARSLV